MTLRITLRRGHVIRYFRTRLNEDPTLDSVDSSLGDRYPKENPQR